MLFRNFADPIFLGYNTIMILHVPPPPPTTTNTHLGVILVGLFGQAVCSHLVPRYPVHPNAPILQAHHQVLTPDYAHTLDGDFPRYLVMEPGEQTERHPSCSSTHRTGRVCPVLPVHAVSITLCLCKIVNFCLFSSIDSLRPGGI